MAYRTQHEKYETWNNTAECWDTQTRSKDVWEPDPVNPNGNMGASHGLNLSMSDGPALLAFGGLFLAYIIFQQVSHWWSTAPLWVHWTFWGLLGAAYLWAFVRHGGIRLLTYVTLGLAALGIAAFGGLLVYAWLLHHPVHPDWQGFWMAVQTKILVHF